MPSLLLNLIIIVPFWCSLFLLGNGPNALSLSYLLSGNVPYYIPHQHPNTILDQKLCEERGKSLLDSVSGNDFLREMVNWTVG